MKTVIIEDEYLFSEQLETLLSEVRPDASVVAVLRGVREAIEWFGSHAVPDVVFSDIRLSDGLSFEIFRQVSLSCPIIFTTAYDEYAIQAFRFNSIHYLQKPVTRECLSEALDKFESLRKGHDIASLCSSLTVGNKNHSSRFFVRRGYDYLPVDVDKVSCIHTCDKVVTLHMKDGGDFVLEKSLKDMESMLDPLLFRRVSRQWILNLKAITKFSCGVMGKGHVIMEPDLDIELSREKYHQVISEIVG